MLKYSWSVNVCLAGACAVDAGASTACDPEAEAELDPDPPDPEADPDPDAFATGVGAPPGSRFRRHSPLPACSTDATILLLLLLVSGALGSMILACPLLA